MHEPEAERYARSPVSPAGARARPFLPYFPYVAPPHNPLNHEHHGRRTREDDDREGRERRAEVGSGEGGRIADALRITTQSPGSRAVLQYTLQQRGRVSLRVFDVQGRAVRTLIDQDAAPGTFRAAWDGLTDRGTVAGRGVFFARLETDGQVLDTKKVVLQ